MTEETVERVLRFALSRELFRPGVVVVALSGGQDSVCMVDILRRLRTPLGIQLHVAHLNHMFRGAQAESEAEYVRALAAEWGLPATVAAVDVPAFRARHRFAKQVAARYARFQFLARVAAMAGARQVSVGHTADDSVETLLMNLMRGSGLAGLRGMVPSRPMAAGQLGPPLESSDWRGGILPPPEGPLPAIVRPILELSREETEAYCMARGIAFRRDPSNLDMAYRRNWIRMELLPLLERRAPGVRERLRNASDLLADEHALVVRATDEAWSALARAGENRVAFDLASWSRLEAALQRQLLRRAVESLAGSLENLGRAHLDAAQAAIRGGSVGARVDLPRGIRLEKGYTSFRLSVPSAEPPVEADLPSEPIPLPVPGVVELAGGALEAELLEVGEGEGPLRRYCSGDRWQACLDADMVGPSLVVRRRGPGDRFVPLGMETPKKLHDFMVDEKIPRGERSRTPLVATPSAIVWVVGHRIDDRFKVTEGTRRVLRLHFRRIANSE